MTESEWYLLSGSLIVVFIFIWRWIRIVEFTYAVSVSERNTAIWLDNRSPFWIMFALLSLITAAFMISAGVDAEREKLALIGMLCIAAFCSVRYIFIRRFVKRHLKY